MERKRVQRKDREGEDLKHSFVKRQIEWRSELLIVCLLGAFAFFVNRHMEIKGLYMDDLYQWYSYNSESFLQAIFTFGGSRCRFLYNLVAWIEMAIFGPHVGWYVPFNILLNTGLAYTLYRMARQFQPKQIFRNSVCADFFDVPHVLLSDWTGTWTDGDDGTVARNFDSLSSVPDFARA